VGMAGAGRKVKAGETTQKDHGRTADGATSTLRLTLLCVGQRFRLKNLAICWWRRNMNEYIFRLGEFKGSDLLEFRKGNDRTERKFQRADSLYVLDDAFFFFLESIIKNVVPEFDMFEDTYISNEQWRAVMQLDIERLVYDDYVQTVRETLKAIDSWVESLSKEDEGFTVLGV
jgi:hypothetical protein